MASARTASKNKRKFAPEAYPYGSVGPKIETPTEKGRLAPDRFWAEY
jgi:hypothetical protein